MVRGSSNESSFPGFLSLWETIYSVDKMHAAVRAVCSGRVQQFYSSRPDVVECVDKKQGRKVKCQFSRSIFKLSLLIRAMEVSIHFLEKVLIREQKLS